jgi:hypothetical protein
MFVLTGIIEDIQFNAVRKETGWEVTQCNVHTGEQLVTNTNDKEFGATLALLIAGEELSCTDELYVQADSFVERQKQAIDPANKLEQPELLKAAFAFRMIP